MNILPSSMTIDELLAQASESPDPIAQEISRRMMGTRCAGQNCDENGARGRTVQSIVEDVNYVVIRFTDGAYLCIDVEVCNGEAEFVIGRVMTDRERHASNLMTPIEEAEYIAKKKAEEAASMKRRIESMRRDLAALEAQS